MLSLFFLAVTLQACSISKQHKDPQHEVIQEMTVLKLLSENNDSNYTKVIFKRSQRIYLIAKNADSYYYLLLNESLQNNSPVLVKRAKEESDIIISVEKTKGK